MKTIPKLFFTVAAATGVSLASVATAQDLIVRSGATYTANVAVGNGNGSFATPSNPSGPTNYGTVSAWSSTQSGMDGVGSSQYLADVNGDGLDDFLTRSNASNTVRVAINNGDLSFGTRSGTAPTYALTGWTTSVSGYGGAGNPFHTGDFNGDGRADILVRDNSGGNSAIRVALNQGNNTFGTNNGSNLTAWSNATQTLGTFTNPYAIADMDGDGNDDLVHIAGSSFNIGLSDGNSTFGAWSQTFGGVQSLAQTTTFADINNDGYADAIGLDNVSGEFRLNIALNNALGDGVAPTFGTGTPTTTLLGWDALLTGYGTITASSQILIFDANGDGNLDIVWHENSGGNNLLYTAFGDGSGTSFGSMTGTALAAWDAQQQVGPYDAGFLEGTIAVPEPGSFALLAGLLGLSAVMLRRRA